MAKECKISQSSCVPDLVPDTVNSEISRAVPPSSDACSSTDKRKSDISFFTTDSDSWAEGVSAEECSMAELGSSSASAKKSAWNKPSSHGVVAEVGGAVMDADSWPTLSESARASPKTPTYTTKSISNGPMIIPPQGIEAGSSSSTTKEVGSRSLTQKQTSMHTGPTRQRSMKRVAGDGDGRSGGSSTHTNMPANGSLSPEVSHQISVKDGGEQGASSHGRKQPPQHQSRNNGGPQIRGNGYYHHNNGGRRDPHRLLNNNGNHGSQRRGPRPVTHSPAPNMQYYFYQLPYPAMPPYVHPEMTPYFWHPPMGPWSPPMAPEMLNPEPVLPLSPKILRPDPELYSKILKQIDYYFSLDNLVKDTYLRENMDAQGWVSISLIANFDKVIELTDNVQDVLEAIRSSSVVEVQDNKVRCRENWQRWIISSTQHLSQASPYSNRPSSSSQNSLNDQLNNLSIN